MNGNEWKMKWKRMGEWMEINRKWNEKGWENEWNMDGKWNEKGWENEWNMDGKWVGV